MRIVCLAAAAALAAGCAAPVAPNAPVATPVPAVAAPGPVRLANAGFELDVLKGARCAPGWSCTMHGDPNSFRFFADASGAPEGKRSYCIEPLKKEPWALLTQATFDPSLRGARLRFSIAVRVADVSGSGAGAWARVQRAGQPPQVYSKLAKGSADWQTQALEFDVPNNAQTVEFGATLNGAGRACFDDARLEILRSGGNTV